MRDEADRLVALRDRFLATIESRLGTITVNGDRTHRIAGNLNLAFPGLDAEHLIRQVSDKVAISTGSACASVGIEPSHVLLAIGIGKLAASGSVRIGFGRFTTVREIDVAANALATAVQLLLTEEETPGRRGGSFVTDR
jgi:cysteine desulfurase